MITLGNYTDEQMQALCESLSKYAKDGYKVVLSKKENRTNPLSLEDGGSIVFAVDHKRKMEMAYTNIKKVTPYINAMLNPKSLSISNFRIEEIYSVDQKKNVKLQFDRNRDQVSSSKSKEDNSLPFC